MQNGFPVPAGHLEQKAEGHIRTTFVLQLVMTGFHGLLVISVLMNVILDLAGMHPNRTYGSSSYDAGRQVGHYLGLGLSAGWAAVGLLWTPLNAWGLHRRAPWARTSTLVYWSVSIATCCCLPFGAIGIYLLTRPGVKERFQGTLPGA
jgi:hypothetical protein